MSGEHFNPVVSLVDASFGGLRWPQALAYLPAQIVGCIFGAVAANAMFAKAVVSISTKHRATPAHLLAEVIATLSLLLVIFSLARTRRGASAPAAVGAYIGAAHFFTSSTSFASPAISVGRMFSDTFAGIAPASVPGYILAQLVGGAVAIGVIRARRCTPMSPRRTPPRSCCPTRRSREPRGSVGRVSGLRSVDRVREHRSGHERCSNPLRIDRYLSTLVD